MGPELKRSLDGWFLFKVSNGVTVKLLARAVNNGRLELDCKFKVACSFGWQMDAGYRHGTSGSH